MIITKLFNKIRLYKIEIFIFFFYTLLTLIITYPLIFKMNSSYYGYPPNDVKGTIWWIRQGTQTNIFTINAPFGVNVSKEAMQPIFLVVYVLFYLTNEIFTYNFFILSSFSISAMLMYFLVYYLTRDKISGAVGGLIFAFSSFFLMRSYAHIFLAMGYWMPLYVISLLMLDQKRNLKSIFFCAIIFVLVMFSNFYYGYYMAIFTATFILFKVFYQIVTTRRLKDVYQSLKIYLITFLISIIVMVPFIFPILKTTFLVQKNDKHVASNTSGYKRPFSDLNMYSARVWDYLVPIADNPIFGRYTKKFRESYEPSDSGEHGLYLGYTAIALAVYGLIRWRRGRRTPLCPPLVRGELREGTEDRIQNTEYRKEASDFPTLLKGGEGGFIVSFFWVMFFVSLIWSSPPFIHIGKITIPMPSYFMYPIFPMFRNYARLVVIALLCLGVLAGYGVKYLLENVKSAKRKALIVSLIIVFILAETINIPPFRNTDISAKTMPPVYKWLAEEKGNFIIVEYPLIHPDVQGSAEYSFYQRDHKKRLFNGAPEGSAEYPLAWYLKDISDMRAPSAFKYLGIKYVIVHDDQYTRKKNPVPLVPPNSGFELIKTFKDTRVYQVVAKPSKALFLQGSNFYQPEVFEDGKTRQWTGEEPYMIFLNYDKNKKNVKADIKFLVSAFMHERTLKISLSDYKNVIKEVKIEPFIFTEVVLKDVKFKFGENLILFSGPEKADSLNTFYHNNDMRKAIFAFSDFNYELK